MYLAHNFRTIFYPLFITLIACSFKIDSSEQHVSALKFICYNQPILIPLPFPYVSLTEEDKKRTIYLEEGCYTILKKDENIEQQSVIIGPLLPCQLCYLDLGDDRILIAHIVYNSNFKALLNKIKNYFNIKDSSKIQGLLHTNWLNTYERPMNKFDGQSWKRLYQNRTQQEELEHNRQLVLNILNITNEDQIETNLHHADDDNLVYYYSKYPLALEYVFIKYSNMQLAIHSTCPVAEGYLLEEYISYDVNKKLHCFNAKRLERSINNKFLLQCPNKNYQNQYGLFDFEYIHI